MSVPSRRPRPPSDPLRDRLVEVRRALLHLHKTLIDAERVAFERTAGRLSNGQFLQALIQDPHFEWLRPYSALVVEIDEALATREPIPAATMLGYVDRVAALTATDDEAGDGAPAAEQGGRYAWLRDRDADVLAAHIEAVRRVTAARADGAA